MADVLSAVRDCWVNKERSAGRQVCVALSGGLDSVALLHAMCDQRSLSDIEVSAVHVHHGLSSQADQWAEFCRGLCADLSVNLRVEKVQVDLDSGLGTEAAARARRYAVFETIEADYLALAHHLDDQAETVLLQMLRGAGLAGLSGMPDIRSLDRGPCLLRPFLGLTRTRILEFARARELVWIEDESNDSSAFDRNFLRIQILPELEKRFPGYRAAFSRASKNMAEAGQLLQLLGERDLADAGIGDGLSLSVIRDWTKARSLNALRCLFKRCKLEAPARTRLEEALRQALEARRDANVRVDFGNHSLRRYRNGLFLVPNVSARSEWSAFWNGEREIALPPGLGKLRFCQTDSRGISLRVLRRADTRIGFRRGGERMALGTNRPTRDLRRLFQDAGVPPWTRTSAPLLWSGERLAFVAGLGVASDFQAKNEEPSLVVEWIMD